MSSGKTEISHAEELLLPDESVDHEEAEEVVEASVHVIH